MENKEYNPYGRDITGPVAKAGLCHIIEQGIRAQQKLNGQKGIFNITEDKEKLEAMVARGKACEERCHQNGLDDVVNTVKSKSWNKLETS